MKRCIYCGREVEDQYQVCPIDQARLVESAASVSPASNPRAGEGFFRWKPTSVILLTFTLVFAVLTVVGFFMAPAFVRRGQPEMVPVVYWGMVHYSAMAILCFTARRWIRRGSPVFRAAAGLAVTLALLILMRCWFAGIPSNRNAYPVTEIVLGWLPLIYVIIYAFRPPKGEQRANSAAPVETAVQGEAAPSPEVPPSASSDPPS